MGSIDQDAGRSRYGLGFIIIMVIVTFPIWFPILCVLFPAFADQFAEPFDPNESPPPYTPLMGR